jgi:plastocyanin/DNA-binding beta-propeller fold protein YncE
MNKNNTGIAVTVVATMLVSALFLTAPASMLNLELPQLEAAFASGATNVVKLNAETLPNGQYAYKMVSHVAGGRDITSKYSNIATIPGPTLVIKEGESLQIKVTDNIAGVDANIQASGFNFGSAKTGTYVYEGKEGSLLGLFGAIVVNAKDGKVESYVDGGNGKTVSTKQSDLKKEFVMFMVGSSFWVSEISKTGSQNPLWINPTISAVEGDLVRFHVLSVGPGHTFHLHAHRWLEPGTSAIIDTKLMEPGRDTHIFTVKAGDEVGPGHWQYHCHVFAHMEAGMHGVFNVVESGSAVSQAGASPYGGHPALADGSIPGMVTFEISDEPGSWFRNTLDISPITQTRSLALAKPGDTVHFIMSDTNTVHTITSLLWPTGAMHMPMDEVQSYKGGGSVQVEDEGLYVFTCKVHPYMFGGVIVDDLSTGPTGDHGSAIGESLDLDDEDGSLTLVTGLTFPTASDLGLRLLRTFFVATTPENYKDYTQDTWNPLYPAVNVRASGIEVGTNDFDDRPGGGGLNGLLDYYFAEEENDELPDLSDDEFIPDVPGVGEVWIDTQFEKTEDKTKPGTATAVDTEDWIVSKKFALPEVNMNNPHNMWTDFDQEVIYQTEWFDNKLTTFDRETGELVSRIKVGEAPSHVMTRTNNGDIHVALNGEEGIAEIEATTSPDEVERIIPMQGFGQNPTHPHAHWMSSDGDKMVTPNSFTGDSSLYGFDTKQIDAKPVVGALPIATGMMPDDSKYYVANLLSSTISVVDMDESSSDFGEVIKTVDLLEDYNPVSIDLSTPGGFLSALNIDSDFTVGALPIQTPVSPDGKVMVTANTLSGTLTIMDTETDEVITTLFCEPGCHGVNFGAKEGGGYYAYVSSKFANDMIVVDPDPNGDGDISDVSVVGKILLVANDDTEADDEPVDGFEGTGGQGVLAIPNVYNGWVQRLPDEWKDKLEPEQLNPTGA